MGIGGEEMQNEKCKVQNAKWKTNKVKVDSAFCFSWQ
jgi:hypothetical protein